LQSLKLAFYNLSSGRLIDLGKISKGEKCALCNDVAVRSISTAEVSRYFNVRLETRRRVYLCKKHYKEYKKRSEEERELERLRW